MSSSAASRDRTGEFMAAVRSFQGRQLNGGPNMQHGRAAGAAASSQRQQQLARQSAEFMKIARSIGGDIRSVKTSDAHELTPTGNFICWRTWVGLT